MTTWLVRGLLVALVAATIVTGTLLLPQDRIYATAAEVADLATYPVLLACAALLYLYFRLAPGADAAWLATAAVFGTAQGIGYAATRVVMEEQVSARPAWMLLSQVVVAALVCLLLAASGRARIPLDPIALGLSLALAITAVRLVLVDRVEPAPFLRDLELVLGAALVLGYAAMGAFLVRRVRLPRWAAWRLAFAACALGLAQLLAYPVLVDGWRSLAVVALDVGGAAVLALTTRDLVHHAVARTGRAEETVRELEAHVRDDQTLLHEVTGTLAGITAASRLLSAPARLPSDERRRLEELLVAETTRLHRLLQGAGDDQLDEDLEAVDLDDLIESLLFVHGIRGRVIAWHPTGHHVRADRDHLLEVLDRLLDNAANHGRSPILAVTVDRRGPLVDLVVADQGSGIPPEIIDSVQEWGARGGSSAGKGIGLHVAHRLVTAMGGLLLIDSDEQSGTRVTITLPAADVARAERTA